MMWFVIGAVVGGIVGVVALCLYIAWSLPRW